MNDFTSRYGSNINDLPDTETMCHGECEGTGWVPVYGDDMEEPWHSLWLKAEEKNHADDGVHFVICPACDGTGLDLEKK